MSSASVTSRDFAFARVQAVAFSSDGNLQTNKLIATLLTKYANRFNGDLQALPLPQEIPPEVPRVVLQSSDQRFRFEVGLSRLSSQWQRTDDDTSDPSVAISECVEVLEYCVQELSPRIGRLALVISRVCPCEAPAETLVQRFCNAATQQRSQNHSIGRQTSRFTITRNTTCRRLSRP